NLEVKTMANDLKKELAYEVKEYNPKVEGFSPKFNKEDTLDYKTDFSVQVSNLLPSSKISITKTQIIKPKKEEVEVNNKGEATIEFEGINDFSQKEITIAFNYIKKGDEKAEQTYTIKLHQYAPSINFNPDIIAEKDKSYELTVVHGKPNEKVEWNLSGDATLGSYDATFNASGEAKATITSKAPFKVNPTLSVITLGKKINAEFFYNFSPKIVEYPSFKGQEKTIDYESDFMLKLNGLKPNSNVRIIKEGVINPIKEIVQADQNGEAVLWFNEIADYKIKNIVIKFKAIKKQDQEVDLISDMIRLYQYSLGITKRDFDERKPNQQAQVTITNGKPNAKIKWDINGDGVLLNMDKAFNSKGEAKAIIASRQPFETDPKIKIEALGQNLEKYIDYPYTPIVELSKNFLYPLQAVTIKFHKLMPNSKIKIHQNQNLDFKQLEYQVDSQGDLVIENVKSNRRLIELHEGENINFEFDYQKTHEQTKVFVSPNISVKIPKLGIKFTRDFVQQEMLSYGFISIDYLDGTPYLDYDMDSFEYKIIRGKEYLHTYPQFNIPTRRFIIMWNKRSGGYSPIEIDFKVIIFGKTYTIHTLL
ncbi:hypothetical protein ACS0H5_000582, partial [Campylobacter lari]